MFHFSYVRSFVLACLSSFVHIDLLRAPLVSRVSFNFLTARSSFRLRRASTAARVEQKSAVAMAAMIKMIIIVLYAKLNLRLCRVRLAAEKFLFAVGI